MDNKITPFLMFEGVAEEAMRFYVSLFRDAELGPVTHYGPGEQGAEGTIKRAEFTLSSGAKSPDRLATSADTGSGMWSLKAQLLITWKSGWDDFSSST